MVTFRRGTSRVTTHCYFLVRDRESKSPLFAFRPKLNKCIAINKLFDRKHFSSISFKANYRHFFYSLIITAFRKAINRCQTEINIDLNLISVNCDFKINSKHHNYNKLSVRQWQYMWFVLCLVESNL